MDLEQQIKVIEKPKYDWKAKSWRIKTRKCLAERDGLACWLCEKPLSFQIATIDHVKPKSEGGSDEIENLKLACYLCNRRRHQQPKQRSSAEKRFLRRLRKKML